MGFSTLANVNDVAVISAQLSTAGTSLWMTRHAEAISRQLIAIDPLLDDCAWIENLCKENGITRPAPHRMSWRLRGCDLVLVEETQDFGFLIAPGPT